MFELIDSKKVDLLNLNANLYEHSKFKTKHLHLESDNSEKVFMVAFKTVPEDSTGIAHILEHTALCGSKRFPVVNNCFSITMEHSSLVSKTKLPCVSVKQSRVKLFLKPRNDSAYG